MPTENVATVYTVVRAPCLLYCTWYTLYRGEAKIDSELLASAARWRGSTEPVLRRHTYSCLDFGAVMTSRGNFSHTGVVSRIRKHDVRALDANVSSDGCKRR
ncbi:uncharacterized protein LOC105191350 [Harpegnathos saltator]|uniref:uncharacterized protein LOC105191350 n=1 Tax=Harpegnathos saltator TaxID=610380 RepID=UPI00058CDA18|nr:uncharacterized protein LOC105191350 [Harpegnathos saltator]